MRRRGATRLALTLLLIAHTPMVLPAAPADGLPSLVTLEGRVERRSGNRLPGPGAAAPSAAAAGYQVVAISGTLPAAGQPLWRQPLPAGRVIGHARTDGTGRFRLQVPAGTVTVLLAVPGGHWLNRFDGQGDYSSVHVRPGMAPLLLLDDRGALH
ncbi:MAG: hypothetical protein VKN13_07525 [Cyanobacteriota bacterium]|nr:hypothetical protein [Cyanobacteriota bacterium]